MSLFVDNKKKKKILIKIIKMNLGYWEMNLGYWKIEKKIGEET